MRNLRLLSAIGLGSACAFLLASAMMDEWSIVRGTAHAAPRVILVTSTADSGPGSLRAAIFGASDGDTIGFALDNNSVITLTTGTLVVTKALTIDGAGAPNLKVSGNGQYRVFRFTMPATIASLTIADGFEGAGDGGAIHTSSALTLTDVSVVDSATFNPSSGSGGGVWANADVVLSGGVFMHNLCRWSLCSGGALYVGGKLRVSGTQLISNTASFGGGIAVIQGATLTNTQFIDNKARNSGGGLYGYEVRLADSKFISNTAVAYGGGAYVHDNAIVNGGIFETNRCVPVGGGCAGGGLYALGMAALTGTQFLSNASASGAGGAFVGSTFAVYGVLFLNNRCSDVTCRGGGLSVNSEGPWSIANTKFIGNEAWEAGGVGVFGSLPSDVQRVLVNDLFARNTAISANGAALLVSHPGVIKLVHATIASSTVASGAAIYASSGTLLVTNTIVASHAVGIAQTGGSVSEDYNLFSGNGTDFVGSVSSGSHHPSGIPAFANPLADDYHLLPGSAAIDSGADLGVPIDLDGRSRLSSVAPDIGAYETAQLLFLPFVAR